MDPLILGDISKPDFDRQKYIKQIQRDEVLRNLLIEQMISNKNIMVYYHCYEIISEASYIRPELFYPHWRSFYRLLNHKNSYHRDIGLTIIANLSKVDTQNLTDAIIGEYMQHIRDAKFMTASCCIRNCSKIMLNKPDLMKKIIPYLINIENDTIFPPKQQDYLIGDIIKAFDVVFDQYENRTELIGFIEGHTRTRSPKTNQLAKEFLLRHGNQ
jgi:hypothetical protein